MNDCRLLLTKGSNSGFSGIVFSLRLIFRCREFARHMITSTKVVTVSLLSEQNLNHIIRSPVLKINFNMWRFFRFFLLMWLRSIGFAFFGFAIYMLHVLHNY